MVPEKRDEKVTARKNIVKPSISDEAVKAKTGKTWAEWFKILDAAGAMHKNHRQITAYLDERFEIDDWWVQMIAVTYEQARGLREVHQKSGGFEISRSKTLEVPVSVLFAALNEQKQLKKWLPNHKIEIRKATPPKSLRVTWLADNTGLNINFYEKGPAKSQIVVQHVKLPNAGAAEKMKIFWEERLNALKEILEA